MSKSKIASEVADTYDPRRFITFKADGTLTIDKQDFVAIEENFAEELVKAMKNNSFYENITVFNGVSYMQKDKYDTYVALFKSLSVTPKGRK